MTSMYITHKRWLHVTATWMHASGGRQRGQHLQASGGEALQLVLALLHLVVLQAVRLQAYSPSQLLFV